MASSSSDEAATGAKLTQLAALIQTSVEAYLAHANDTRDGSLPSRPLFEAQRTLLAAAGLLTELVSAPSSRLLEVSSQYMESRALHVAANQRVADKLAAAGDAGLDLPTLAEQVGIEPRKLGRLLRCLCSIHVFRETAEDQFANNAISAALVGNEPLRAYILMFGLDIYSASDSLPKTLLDPARGPSYDVACTPWQDAANSTKTRWEWLEETTQPDKIAAPHASGSDGAHSAYPGVFGAVVDEAVRGKGPTDGIPRPEHGIFGLAMLGGGRIFGEAHVYDFPWASLGKATVVDVGGGVGGLPLHLARRYPDLQFVVQDRPPVLEQAQAQVWPQENPEALAAGRVTFMAHDFFQTNPVRAADVYWLRYILHDWADDYCVRILTGIKASMGPRSRILICDQVMNTTVGTTDLTPAPAPLLANWGYYTRYSHQRDLGMMAIINGIERKPAEFRALADAAGLHLRKIWDCRSQVGLVELTLPDSTL